MSQQADQVAQFKADVATMKVKEANVGLERGLAVLGWLLVVAAAVLAVFAIVTTLNAGPFTEPTGATSNLAPAEQRDAIVYGLMAVTFAIIGGVLVLRFSFGTFLRYWLARLVFEQQRKG